MRGICKTTCRDKAQEAIDIAVEWARKSGLQFSPAKSQVLFITLKKKGNAIPPKPLTMYGKELEYVNEVIYLGVKIDKNLSWNPHIEHKIKKVKQCMYMCRNSLAKMYGPKPTYMRWLYTSVLRPQMTYGCYVWAQQAEANKKKLEKLERIGLKMCSFVRHSTPTDALRII